MLTEYEVKVGGTPCEPIPGIGDTVETKEGDIGMVFNTVCHGCWIRGFGSSVSHPAFRRFEDITRIARRVSVRVEW